MEEQIGRSQNFSDPNSNFDATLEKMAKLSSKIDTHFDGLAEQLDVLIALVQSLSKESEGADADSNIQSIDTQVPLEAEALSLFDEMPKSISAAGIDDQLASEVSFGRHEEYFHGEEDKLHNYSAESTHDSTMALTEGIIHDEKTYNRLRNESFRLVNTSLSLLKAPFANVIAIISLNHRAMRIEENNCLLKPSWLFGGIDKFSILESHVCNVVIFPKDKGMLYEHKTDVTSLRIGTLNSLVLDYFSIDNSVMFLFDPGGKEIFKLVYALLKEGGVLLEEQNFRAEIFLVTTDTTPPACRFSPFEFRQGLIEVDGENTDKIGGEDPLLSFDLEVECYSSMTLEEHTTKDQEIYDQLDYGLCILVIYSYFSLFESPYADIRGVCSINHGDTTVVRNKCFFKPSWFCSGYVNFGYCEKHMCNVLIILIELVYEHKIGRMYFSSLIHDPLVFAYVFADHGVILLFDPGGHANLKVDCVLNLVLHMESRVLLVEPNSEAEISMVTTSLACGFSPCDFRQVAAVSGNSTLHSKVGMVFFVEGKEYLDMNSQEQVGATGQKKKKSVWFLAGKYVGGSKRYKKVVGFIDYDCNFNVKCRLNKAMLVIHIEGQTSGDLKLIGHNLQMINNASEIVDSIGFIFDIEYLSWFSIFIFERVEIATRAADWCCLILSMLHPTIYLQIYSCFQTCFWNSNDASFREYAPNIRAHSPVYACCCFTFVISNLSTMIACISTPVKATLAANELFEDETSSLSLLSNGERISERIRKRIGLVIRLLVAVAVSTFLLHILIFKVKAGRDIRSLSERYSTMSCFVLHWPTMWKFDDAFCHQHFGVSIHFRIILESLNGVDCLSVTIYTFRDAMGTELGQMNIEIKQLIASRQELTAEPMKQRCSGKINWLSFRASWELANCIKATYQDFMHS